MLALLISDGVQAASVYGSQAPLPCLVDLVVCLWSFLNEHILFSVFLQIKDMLKPEVMEEIMLETRQRLLEQEG